MKLLKKPINPDFSRIDIKSVDTWDAAYNLTLDAMFKGVIEFLINGLNYTVAEVNHLTPADVIMNCRYDYYDSIHQYFTVSLPPSIYQQKIELEEYRRDTQKYNDWYAANEAYILVELQKREKLAEEKEKENKLNARNQLLKKTEKLKKELEQLEKKLK